MLPSPSSRLTSLGARGAGRRTRLNEAQQFAVDAAGRVLSTTDELGHVTSQGYNAAGRRTSMTDALGNTTSFAYDAAGNQTSTTDALQHTVTTVYDAANRSTATILADNTSEQTEYDAAGNRTARIDAAGVRTEYAYDLNGRLTSVKDALGHFTRYTYDELGNRLTQTDANSHTTSFEYDQLGRRAARVLPAGQREEFTYRADGQLDTRKDFNGHTTRYAYDVAGRMVQRTPDAAFAGEAAVQWTYTASGRRQTMTDGTGLTSYQYDARDRLVQRGTPEGTLSYTYDAAGNRLRVQSDSGVYDVGYGYDANNRVLTMGTSVGAATISSYSYDLDPTGNRVAVHELGGRTVNWGYDSLYRLSSETISGASAVGGAAAQNGVIGYSYDAVGNRLTRASTVPAIAPQGESYDADDRMASDGYDSGGNTLASGGKAFAYDSENRLVGLNAGQATYRYDGDGQLVGKTAAGTTTSYVIDGENPTGYTQIAEERAGGAVSKSYAYGPQRISIRDGGEMHYYGYDAHSGVRALFDASGAVTDTYDYDAFGTLLARSGTTSNDFTYRGEQIDSALGRQYLRARWMNPNSGRFVSRDTFEGSPRIPKKLNSYVYGGDDGVGARDPSGHDFDSESIGAAFTVGTLLGLPTSAGDNANTNSGSSGLDGTVSYSDFTIDAEAQIASGLATDILSVLQGLGYNGLTQGEIKGFTLVFASNFYGVVKSPLPFLASPRAAQSDFDTKYIYMPQILRVLASGARTGIGNRSAEAVAAHEVFHEWDKLVRHSGDLNRYHKEHVDFRNANGWLWYLKAPWEAEAQNVQDAFEDRMSDPCNGITGCN